MRTSTKAETRIGRNSEGKEEGRKNLEPRRRELGMIWRRRKKEKKKTKGDYGAENEKRDKEKVEQQLG